jgi:hypothetical protein
MTSAVAGAVLSTIATIAQMAMVLGATSWPTLRTLSISLASAGLTAVVYGAFFTILALRQKAGDEAKGGRAFNLTTALVFALTLSCIMVASAALQEWFGENGIILAAALAGFVDTHSAAISVASLVASGKMSAADAVLPILTGLSTNTLSKLVLAGTSGGRSFAVRVMPGLILVVLAAWGVRLTHGSLPERVSPLLAVIETAQGSGLGTAYDFSSTVAAARRRYKSRLRASGNQSYRNISRGRQFATQPRIRKLSSTRRLNGLSIR